MWKQFLIGALVVGLYIGHDLWKRNANPLNGLHDGAEFVDGEGTRYTCRIGVRVGGGYLIELRPSSASANLGGM